MFPPTYYTGSSGSGTIHRSGSTVPFTLTQQQQQHQRQSVVSTSGVKIESEYSPRGSLSDDTPNPLMTSHRGSKHHPLDSHDHGSESDEDSRREGAGQAQVGAQKNGGGVEVSTPNNQDHVGTIPDPLYSPSIASKPSRVEPERDGFTLGCPGQHPYEERSQQPTSGPISGSC